jgi:hypothetical protein
VAQTVSIQKHRTIAHVEVSLKFFAWLYAGFMLTTAVYTLAVVGFVEGVYWEAAVIVIAYNITVYLAIVTSDSSFHRTELRPAKIFSHLALALILCGLLVPVAVFWNFVDVMDTEER